jgi:Alpha/beta hydrolase domain
MRRSLISAAAILLFTAAADARVTRIEIGRSEPFAPNQQFGDTGAYQKIIGRFYGELDPSHPLNAGVVDLGNAPRNANGRVGYSADFYILKPVDLSKGNGALLYDVNNRGNKRALIQFNSAPAANDPSTPEQAGNGFLMRQGFTIVFSGWLPTVPVGNDVLRLEVPVASAATPAIEQVIWDEFLFNDRTTTQAKLSFPALSTADAKLLVRDRNSQPPRVIPNEQWEFVDAKTIRLLPAGTPFAIGAIYQLTYRAKEPPVAGIGFAATRDLVSFLRHRATDDAGTANPLALAGRPAVQRALAHGTSQSGRYLRDFLYRGFNEDEDNRIVFEGMNPHVATGRLFLNFRFAQPNRMLHIAHGFQFYPDVSFPFAYQDETDPFTGKRDGILLRCSARGNCPKIIHTVTSTEYWQSGQSLITTDPLGKRDVTLPDGVRVYHFAGMQHVGRQATMPKGICAMAPNNADYAPLLRAVLLNLDRWVRDDVPPPPSRYARLDQDTLAPMIAQLGTIPGFTPARAPSSRARFDYGASYENGTIDNVLPIATGQTYGVLVPKVDADGNEVAGLRMPEIAVPTGTATGWSVRGPGSGGEGELCYLDGSFVPFAKTRAEREASGDVRPSLAERYRDHADYVSKIDMAANALAQDGYLLREDVPRFVERASTAAW